MPVSADGLDWRRSCSPPNPPAFGASVCAFVSPVSVKTKRPKCEPGWNCPFSGRLNGVAPAVLASAFAWNGCVPSALVSWIVIQRVRNTCP